MPGITDPDYIIPLGRGEIKDGQESPAISAGLFEK